MYFQRTVIGGGELLARLRPLWCFIAVVSFGQGVGLLPAWAAPAPTITTLSVISGGNAVTTVVAGSVVTLTATVILPAALRSRRVRSTSAMRRPSSAPTSICWARRS